MKSNVSDIQKMRSKVRRSLPPEGLLSKEANAQQMENLAMLACWVRSL